MIAKPLFWTCVTLITLLFAGCSDDTAGEADSGLPDVALSDLGSPDAAAPACDSKPVLRKTTAGVEFVRTPESCFDKIPNFPFKPKHVELDGLRQAYVEDGPATGDPVLLLHGQPSWGYLYRKMIPVLSKAGYRVIAMDHLGTGRSDKPTQIKSYSFLGHVQRLEKFITALGLKNITLFCQDWGSLIGLHVAGKHPDWFARIVVGDGSLSVVPAGVKPYPDPKDPDKIDDTLPTPFAGMPAQQIEFYDKDCKLKLPGNSDFGKWMAYAMKSSKFHAAEVLEAMTWFDLPTDEEAAYDAPFPSRIYMAGIRVFPSLVNELGGANQTSWDGLKAYTKPFLTIWAGNDPGNLGQCATQDNLICNIPGAKGQPHTRLPKASHFLQDDQGAEIAKRMVDFMSKTPTYKADHTPTCALPIAPDGTGTPCSSDADCSALTANTCISVMGGAGFCSVEGCSKASCATNYVCCHDCNPAAAPLLPFTGSACFPSGKTAQLTGLAGCTCD
jgi:haloalkane dehalogenase